MSGSFLIKFSPLSPTKMEELKAGFRQEQVFDWTDLNLASFRWSPCACRLGQSGSPRSWKRTDSLVKGKNSHAVPVVASKLSGRGERLTFARPWFESHGLRCAFSSDPAVSSSIFVGENDWFWFGKHIDHRNHRKLNYSQTCPCDHLTKATTWKLRTRNFSPFNLRIQMYGVHSWNCDHLRNANCGHRRSAQSADLTCEKRPRMSDSAKNTFRSSNFSFAGTPNERSSRLQAPLGMVVAPRTRGDCRSPMPLARARACVKLCIENFWTKPGKWDHLRNRTTYSQSLRWS